MGEESGTILVECVDDLFVIELGIDGAPDSIRDSEAGGRLPERERPDRLVPAWARGHLLDIDRRNATIAMLLDRRPPLMVSHDLGRTWSERGAGLAPGRALAVDENPDRIVVAGRNRLFVSFNGGVFWRSLTAELPEINDVAWGEP